MPLSRVADHEARALARLLSQFKGKPRIAAVVGALSAEVQAVEDAFWDLATERWLDLAVGEQLDGLGEVVGQERLGYADADYKGLLRARIRANRSSGTMDQLVEVVRLAVGEPTFAVVASEPAADPATVLLVLGADPVVDSGVVNRLLQDAKAAGVKLYVEAVDGPTSGAFTFSDTGLVVSSTTQGFGDTADAGVGGILATVYE